jgi:hypothetical protein
VLFRDDPFSILVVGIHIRQSEADSQANPVDQHASGTVRLHSASHQSHGGGRRRKLDRPGLLANFRGSLRTRAPAPRDFSKSPTDDDVRDAHTENGSREKGTRTVSD